MTTVGETAGVSPEVTSRASGGGFSEYFPRPAWQGMREASDFYAFAQSLLFVADKQVEAYLEYWGPTYASFFNRNGRGFPDVAAQGAAIQTRFFCVNRVSPYLDTGNLIPTYDEGQFGATFGTSAAAPMVASLFALLNDYRLSNGHPRLGFINPLLYSSKAQNCYHDMLNGTNPGVE